MNPQSSPAPWKRRQERRQRFTQPLLVTGKLLLGVLIVIAICQAVRACFRDFLPLLYNMLDRPVSSGDLLIVNGDTRGSLFWYLWNICFMVVAMKICLPTIRMFLRSTIFDNPFKTGIHVPSKSKQRTYSAPIRRVRTVLLIVFLAFSGYTLSVRNDADSFGNKFYFLPVSEWGFSGPDMNDYSGTFGFCATDCDCHG